MLDGKSCQIFDGNKVIRKVEQEMGIINTELMMKGDGAVKFCIDLSQKASLKIWHFTKNLEDAGNRSI